MSEELRSQAEILASIAEAREDLGASLADLKATIRSDPRTRPLAMAVEVMYPPAFASEEEGKAAERFPEALSRARQVVTTWT